jgi:hypothetical protein
VIRAIRAGGPRIVPASMRGDDRLEKSHGFRWSLDGESAHVASVRSSTSKDQSSLAVPTGPRSRC